MGRQRRGEGIAEAEVWVGVDCQPVSTRHEVRPLSFRIEPVVDGDPWAMTFAETSDTADDLMRLVIAGKKKGLPRDHTEKMSDLQARNVVNSDGIHERFIDDSEHNDDVSVLGLADELGEDADVIETALRVGYSHDAVKEIEYAQTTRVVECVLTKSSRVSTRSVVIRGRKFE